METTSFTYKTGPCSDVLIIGGGLAGMYSALAAAESGAAVRIHLQKQDRRLRQFGGGHVGAPLRAGRARPARGLPPPLPCFRRGTAGRGARGVLCRSRCRGHGAAARSRPAARIPDAFGKRRGISVSRLLLAQAGTHSDEGRAGEAERVSQYRRGGRRDRLRYSYRKRGRAQGVLALCGGEMRVYPAKR